VNAQDLLTIFVRWVHILSAITLLGGILYARVVVAPSLRVLASETQDKLGEALAARYRLFLYTAIAGLLISGTYNLLNKQGATALYHAVIGIKMLLALHVFAVSFLIVQPNNPKRARQMTGVIISGLVIVALSAWLRRMSLP
jgi:uncharacterized membrane protein